MTRRIRAVFLDLDNTLYDWLKYFAPALRGMCARLSELSGVPLRVVYEDFREVFSAHGTVEYSWALQETRCLRKLHPDLSAAEIYDRYRPAVDVFQHWRRRLLKPYPGVSQGLGQMRAAGIKCVAVTDAHFWQSSNRIRQLGIDGLLDGMAGRPDHETATPEDLSVIRRYPDEYYRSEVQQFVVPTELRKPDPALLRYLMRVVDVDPQECMYVGDSLSKDILMAQKADILDCWAAYGSRFTALDMATLVQVTNWSRADVAKALHPTPDAQGIAPTLIAQSFPDIVRYAVSYTPEAVMT